jgi:hypothetical protein
VIDASAFQLLLMELTGWLARREREALVYLIEENRCLRRQLGDRRLRLTDEDRRRLAARAYCGAAVPCARSPRSRRRIPSSGGIAS